MLPKPVMGADAVKGKHDLCLRVYPFNECGKLIIHQRAVGDERFQPHTPIAYFFHDLPEIGIERRFPARQTDGGNAARLRFLQKPERLITGKLLPLDVVVSRVKAVKAVIIAALGNRPVDDAGQPVWVFPDLPRRKFRLALLTAPDYPQRFQHIQCVAFGKICHAVAALYQCVLLRFEGKPFGLSLNGIAGYTGHPFFYSNIVF